MGNINRNTSGERICLSRQTVMMVGETFQGNYIFCLLSMTPCVFLMVLKDAVGYSVYLSLLLKMGH